MATEQQDKALSEAVSAAESCAKRAEWCSRIGLTVLAREYDYFAKSLQRAIGWQWAALTPKPPGVTSEAEIKATIEEAKAEQQLELGGNDGYSGSDTSTADS